MTTYHPTVEKIKSLLDSHGVDYKCFEHEAVRTSEEAAAIRPEYTLSQGAKALLVRVTERDKTKRFIQLVVPGDAKFDAKKVRHELAIRDVRFASPEEVSELTAGVQPGGVPPFGNVFDLPVFVEQTLLDNQEIIFNAGDKRYSIAVAASDYVKVVQPTVVRIV